MIAFRIPIHISIFIIIPYFEQVVIQAAKAVIGDHLIIQGCFYHLCQSSHRKLQELRLKNKYNNDNDFGHYYSQGWARYLKYSI